MKFIDTHCHLDDERYFDDVAQVITNAQTQGVYACVIPAASPHTLTRAKELAATWEHIYFACGLHPCEIAYIEREQNLAETKNEKKSNSTESTQVKAESTQPLITTPTATTSLATPLTAPTLPIESPKPLSQAETERILAHNRSILHAALTPSNEAKCVAIGECGLDYYHFLDNPSKHDQKHIQKRIFIDHITYAIEKDLPLIVHIREASNDAYEILRDFPEARGILHCYNADEILLNLSDRFYYGIGGVATFKNARRLLEVLPKIPLHRIVLETDAPYLTPHPYRGQRNSPEYIPLIAQRLADILSLPLDEIARTSTQNAKELFRIV